MQMARIGIAGLGVVVAFVLCGFASASASASAQLCFKVDVGQPGTFEDPGCTKAKAGGEYITATLVRELKPGLYCARVDEPGKGTFKNAGCSEELAKGEYIKVRPLCYLVDGTETGTFEDENCTKEKAKGKYIEIEKLETEIHPGLWCAKVDKVGTGDYLEANCETGGAKSEYILVQLPSVEPEKAIGPSFLTSAGLLGAGETAPVTVSNLGDFTLKPSVTGEPEQLCTGLSAPTTLLGGAPGKSDTEIKFTGCTVVGHEKCDVLSAGGTPTNITIPVHDELVYTGTKSEAEMEEGPLGDLITPASGNTLVTLRYLALESGACPSSAVEVAVTGSAIGTVEPVNAMSKQGMLTFPKKSIKEGWQWLSKGKVDEVRAVLSFAGGVTTLIGLADLELENGEEWGTLTA